MTNPASDELIAKLEYEFSMTRLQRYPQIEPKYLDALFARIKQDAETIKRMDDALAFYANPEIYKPHPHGPAFDRRDLSYAAKAARKEPS